MQSKTKKGKAKRRKAEQIKQSHAKLSKAKQSEAKRCDEAREQRNQAAEARGTRLGRVPRGTGPSDNKDQVTGLIGLSKNPLTEAELGKRKPCFL